MQYARYSSLIGVVMGQHTRAGCIQSLFMCDLCAVMQESPVHEANDSTHQCEGSHPLETPPLRMSSWY